MTQTPTPKGDEEQEMTVELKAAFWSRVDKRGPDECWHWTGAMRGPKGIAKDGGIEHA